MLPDGVRNSAALSQRGDGYGTRDSRVRSRDGGALTRPGQQYGSRDPSEEARVRGNAAVRRTRIKNRVRINQMVDRCGHLRKENSLLEEKVDALMEELDFLKRMFLTHASGKTTSVTADDLARVMCDLTPGPDLISDVTEADDEVQVQQLQAGEQLWFTDMNSR